MIVLRDLFSILTTGAYANTTFSGMDNVLEEKHYEKVINLINSGVLELYKRFKFLENEIVLHVDPSVTRYYLKASNMAPKGHTSTMLYIEEPSDLDGLLNIVRVIDAYDSTGTTLRINNPKLKPNDTLPQIVILSPEIIQVTNVITPQAVSLTYQAYPNKIVLADMTLADVPDYELNIPDLVIEPLVLYIAAKTFKPMGANNSTANADKGNDYEQQYELACQKLMMYGLDMDDHTERDQFTADTGWV